MYECTTNALLTVIIFMSNSLIELHKIMNNIIICTTLCKMQQIYYIHDTFD